MTTYYDKKNISNEIAIELEHIRTYIEYAPVKIKSWWQDANNDYKEKVEKMLDNMRKYGYEIHVDYYSQKKGIDKNLILAIIAIESKGEPGITGSAGYCGLMQVSPESYNWYLGESHYYDKTKPETLIILADKEINVGTSMLANKPSRDNVEYGMDNFPTNAWLWICNYNCGNAPINNVVNDIVLINDSASEEEEAKIRWVDYIDLIAEEAKNFFEDENKDAEVGKYAAQVMLAYEMLKNNGIASNYSVTEETIRESLSEAVDEVSNMISSVTTSSQQPQKTSKNSNEGKYVGGLQAVAKISPTMSGGRVHG